MSTKEQAPVPERPSLLARTPALCFSLALMGGQLWGQSVLSRHMAESLHHGDPQAASIARVQGPYFIAGTMLLLALQLVLRFPPLGLERQIRRSMLPLFVLLLTTEATWLSWALQDFRLNLVTNIMGAAAAVMGTIAPILGGMRLRRLPKPAREDLSARWRLWLLLFLYVTIWLWTQAFWLAVSVEA